MGWRELGQAMMIEWMTWRFRRGRGFFFCLYVYLYIYREREKEGFSLM